MTGEVSVLPHHMSLLGSLLPLSIMKNLGHGVDFNKKHESRVSVRYPTGYTGGSP